MEDLVDLDNLNSLVAEGNLNSDLMKQLSNLVYNGTEVALSVMIPDED